MDKSTRAQKDKKIVDLLSGIIACATTFGIYLSASSFNEIFLGFGTELEPPTSYIIEGRYVLLSISILCLLSSLCILSNKLEHLALANYVLFAISCLLPPVSIVAFYAPLLAIANS